jgi:hypothetical protein
LSDYVPIPLDCPGSLLPVSGLTPGIDKVRCDFCGREVVVRPPPPEGFRKRGLRFIRSTDRVYWRAEPGSACAAPRGRVP